MAHWARAVGVVVLLASTLTPSPAAWPAPPGCVANPSCTFNTTGPGSFASAASSFRIEAFRNGAWVIIAQGDGAQKGRFDALDGEFILVRAFGANGMAYAQSGDTGPDKPQNGCLVGDFLRIYCEYIATGPGVYTASGGMGWIIWIQSPAGIRHIYNPWGDPEAGVIDSAPGDIVSMAVGYSRDYWACSLRGLYCHGRVLYGYVQAQSVT